MIKHIFILLIIIAAGNRIYAQKDAYIIQRGDVLDVTVMEHPEFSLSGIIVLPDGYVQYPALGSLKAAGITSEQMRDSLQNSLEKYIVNPMVTIFIRKIQNQQLNIYGYVNKPGQYQLYDSLDLFSAIGVAGGLKSFKKITNATIIRANRTVEVINIRSLFKSDPKNQRVPMVYAGDTLFVKEPNQVNWAMLSFITSFMSLAITLSAYKRWF
jgi:polysaccharide export outer membrane protein